MVPAPFLMAAARVLGCEIQDRWFPPTCLDLPLDSARLHHPEIQDPKRRKSAHDFMKLCRAEYDRLIEQSPPIDDKIIKQFKHSKFQSC